MELNQNTEESTDFKGPISLDAILNAVSKGGETKKEVVEPKVELPKKPVEVKQEEPIVEPKAVEEKEEVKVEPVIETPIVEVEEETDSYKKALNLISLGFLEDFRIQTSDEDEDGTLISEFKGMSEEQLQEIISISKNEKKEEINSKYISKEGLREHELKVIEILKNGGDLSQIAETEEKAFQRPFEGFDMDVRERQIDVVYTDLVSSKGLDPDSAIDLIKSKESRGILEKEAKDLFDAYRKAHKDYIDGILKEQQKEKEFKELNFKENKKVLTAKLKEAGLKESAYKKVVSEYANRNEKGEFQLIEKLKEILNNPEENHEVILHLADKELFNNVFKIKSAHETTKTIVKLNSMASQRGNKKSVKTETTDNQAPWLKFAQQHNDRIKQ